MNDDINEKDKDKIIKINKSQDISKENTNEELDNYEEIQKEYEGYDKKHFLNINVNALIKDISSKIVLQDDAIKTLVTNIYYNQLLIDDMSSDYYMDVSELDSRKVCILLDGSTGTGKTAILKEIASALDIPIYMSNANSYSETGYVGPSITDMLRKLYILAGRNISKAERGVLVVDEIDKLASTVTANGKDMKKGVQEELLGFMSGSVYDFPLEEGEYRSQTIHFDTSKLTFVLSGAFTNLKEKKIKEINENNKIFGFNNNCETNKEESYIVTPQDYVNEGLNREFFGRIKVLSSTVDYKFEDLKYILLNSLFSPLRNFEKTVKLFGYNEVIYSDEFIDKVASQALEMKTGARALQTIISGVQNRILLKLINREYDYSEPIYIDESLLEEYNKSLVRKL